MGLKPQPRNSTLHRPGFNFHAWENEAMSLKSDLVNSIRNERDNLGYHPNELNPEKRDSTIRIERVADPATEIGDFAVRQVTLLATEALWAVDRILKSIQLGRISRTDNNMEMLRRLHGTMGQQLATIERLHGRMWTPPLYDEVGRVISPGGYACDASTRSQMQEFPDYRKRFNLPDPVVAETEPEPSQWDVDRIPASPALEINRIRDDLDEIMNPRAKS